MKITFILDKILNERKISMRQLAPMIGRSYPTVMNLCKHQTNRIDFDVLEKLCNVLSCTPNDLFSFELEEGDKEKFKASFENGSNYNDDLKKFVESEHFQNILRTNIIEILKEEKDDTK